MLDHGDAEAVKITSSERTTRVRVRVGDDPRDRDPLEVEGIELRLGLEVPVELLVDVTRSELANGLHLGFLDRDGAV